VRLMDAGGDTHTWAFTIMPDHLHWLFRLTGRLELGEVIAKLKFISRRELTANELAWQRDYYDHCLRPEESLEDYALYIFLNPYRAGLLAADAIWPWWWTAEPRALRFVTLLGPRGDPPPEWISDPVPARVRHGE